jgi:hypothetical protein
VVNFSSKLEASIGRSKFVHAIVLVCYLAQCWPLSFWSLRDYFFYFVCTNNLQQNIKPIRGRCKLLIRIDQLLDRWADRQGFCKDSRVVVLRKSFTFCQSVFMQVAAGSISRAKIGYILPDFSEPDHSEGQIQAITERFVEMFVSIIPYLKTRPKECGCHFVLAF